MSRKSGKVISVIEYRKGGHRIDVELRLIKTGLHQFQYRIDHDQPRIFLTSDNPTEVSKQALAELDRLLTITWENVLTVEVERENYTLTDGGYNSYGGRRANKELRGRRELVFSINEYSLGTTTTGGRVYRHPEHNDANPQEGLPRVLRRMEAPDPDDGSSSAVLPDTPENRLKLQGIVDALNLLGERLSDLMSQDKIVGTLENVRILGLPAPKGKA